MNLAFGPACLLLVMVASFGCASPHPSAVDAGGTRISYELNFLGVTATDWSKEFDFYTRSLGFRAHSQHGHWALLGAGWDDYVTGRSRGLVCELFERNQAYSDSTESQRPNFLLGLTVRDPATAIASAAARGVNFRSSIAADGTSRRFEFATPAGLRWCLDDSESPSARTSLNESEILRVELEVANLPGQIVFYHDLLGMPLKNSTATTAMLQQWPDAPQLILRTGIQRDAIHPASKAPDPALAQPAFLGFMTPNVRLAAAQLKKLRVPMLTEVQHHDWGGTDIIAADADGNAVQIFTLDDPRVFGAERP